MDSKKHLPGIATVGHFFLLAFALTFCSCAVLHAQQTASSSASKPQPAAETGSTLRNHLTLEGAAGGDFGGGLQSSQYLDPGITGMAGAGYRVNRRLSVFLEGNYYHNKMPAPVLQTAQETGGSYNTFTISGDPMVHIYQGAKIGYYAIGGGGFSHVATSFNKPIGSTINCAIYSGLGYANFTNFCNGKITGSSYSTTQAMYDMGMGIDAHLLPTHRERIFVETRYVKIMTPANQLPGPNIGLVAITGGVRW